MAQPIILVAEDEPIVAHDLCDTVEEAGFTVAGPFDDASSAMQSFRENKPDLAILDVNLQDGTAFSLAEQMMAQDVPVIFHSGAVSADEMHAMFPNAATLAKPCPPNVMIETVQQALDGN